MSEAEMNYAWNLWENKKKHFDKAFYSKIPGGLNSLR
jgi:hypothetical protein